MGTSDALIRTAEAHAARIRRPFGRCLEASERLALDLCRKGIDARVVRCSDGLMDAPHADRRWLRLKRAPLSWVHYVVLVEDVFVDLTRRQFHPDAPHPYIAPAADLLREWRTISPVPLVERLAS